MLQSVFSLSSDIDHLYISHEGLLLDYETAMTKLNQISSINNINIESSDSQSDVNQRSSESKQKELKSIASPKIMVQDPSSQLSVDSKEEADELSKKFNLLIFQIFNQTKNKRFKNIFVF